MKNKQVLLNIPFYRSTTRYSCGAASALMILGFFKKIKLTRKNEFELWKESITLPFKSSFLVIGLANLFARRGLKTTVITPLKKSTFVELKVIFIHEHIPNIARDKEFKHYKFYREVQIKTAKQLGVKFISRKPVLKDVTDSLKSNNPIIVLTDDWWLRKNVWKKKLRHMLHWVVVIGFDNKFIKIIDPFFGRINVPQNMFPKLMDTEKYTKMSPNVIKIHH